jgi:hypothetical protein
MERTDILIWAGEPDGEVFERFHFEGDGAIRVGYKYFKDVMDKRADWLKHATVKRDFNDHMTITMRMLIGPKPYWENGPPSSAEDGSGSIQ